MSNDDRYRNYLDGAMVIASPETIERARRCQNCMHFDNSDAAIAHYKQKMHAEMMAKAQEVLARDGVRVQGTKKRLADDELTPSEMDMLGIRYDLGDQYVREGMLGICLKDNADGDFVHAYYLCERWEQKYKPDTADGHVDELPEEARKNRGMD